MSSAVCPGRCYGSACRFLRITENHGRVRSFRASLALALLHNHTILTQSVQAGLSTAADLAPTGKEDKAFLMRRHEAREPSGTEWHGSQEGTTLRSFPLLPAILTPRAATLTQIRT